MHETYGLPIILNMAQNEAGHQPTGFLNSSDVPARRPALFLYVGDVMVMNVPNKNCMSLLFQKKF